MINEEMDLRPPLLLFVSFILRSHNVRTRRYIHTYTWRTLERKLAWEIMDGKKKKGKDLLPCSTVLTLSSRFLVFPGKVSPSPPPPPPSSATYFLRTRTVCLERKRASKKFCANSNAKNSGWLRRMLSKRRAAAKIPVYPYCHLTVELLYSPPRARFVSP